MKVSIEKRKKLSASLKGNQNRTGSKFTEESLQLRTGINKDKIVYNNGERNIFLRIGEEVPEGFVKGKIFTKEGRRKISDTFKQINERRWHGKECSNTESDQ